MASKSKTQKSQSVSDVEQKPLPESETPSPEPTKDDANVSENDSSTESESTPTPDQPEKSNSTSGEDPEDGEDGEEEVPGITHTAPVGQQGYRDPAEGSWEGAREDGVSEDGSATDDASQRPTEVPDGKIIWPGERLTIDAEVEGNEAVVTTPVYRARKVPRSKRYTFLLVHAKGARIPLALLKKING